MDLAYIFFFPQTNSLPIISSSFNCTSFLRKQSSLKLQAKNSSSHRVRSSEFLPLTTRNVVIHPSSSTSYSLSMMSSTASFQSVSSPLPSSHSITKLNSHPVQLNTSDPQKKRKTLFILLKAMAFALFAYSLTYLPILYKTLIAATTTTVSALSSVIASSSSPSVPSTSSSLVYAFVGQFILKIPDHLTFWIGEFLTWNPAAKLFGLLIFTAAIIVAGGYLFKRVDDSLGNERKEVDSPFWRSFRAIANPLEDDFASKRLRFVAAFLAGLGMIFFAVLVGMVTESVESIVYSMNTGRSKMMVSDHYLFCNWNRQLPSIVKSMKIPKGQRVVIMADKSHDSIIEELRESFTKEEIRDLRITYRTGVPVLKQDLEMVSAESAAKIIIVQDEELDSMAADRQILGQVIAINKHAPTFKGDFVAHVQSPKDASIVRQVMKQSKARSVVTVSSDYLLGNFLAQAVKQPGLSDIVETMMGPDQATVFHISNVKKVCPELIGMRFTALSPTTVPGSIVCGFVDPFTNEVQLGLGHDHVINAQTELVLVGKIDEKRGKPTLFSDKDLLEGQPPRSAPARKKIKETFLICGWRDEMNNMLVELDSIVGRGSSVTILTQKFDDARKDITENSSLLKNLKVNVEKGTGSDLDTLNQLYKKQTYDHVVLLSDEQASSNYPLFETDCKNLAILVNLQQMLNQDFTSVTVEFLSDQVAMLARDNSSLANIIQPEKLGPRIASQALRDHRLNNLWCELLGQEGHEIYVRSVQEFVDLENPRSFAEISSMVNRTRGTVCLGYKKEGKAPVINPVDSSRWSPFKWTEKDSLIVLALD